MTKKKREPETDIRMMLARQVYALVHETAEAVCPEDKDVIELEAELLDHLMNDCKAKRDIARMLAGDPGKGN